MSKSDGTGGPPSGFYTTKEVCRLLDVFRETLARMVREGRILKPFKFIAGVTIGRKMTYMNGCGSNRAG